MSNGRFFEFVETSGGIYIIPTIPDIRLKLSIHTPRPPMLPDMHAHWSSEKLNFHEDVNPAFSLECLKELAMGFIESFKYCRLSGDENIIVLPPFLISASKTETLRGIERTVMDVGRLMETLCKSAIYKTKAKKLPLLIKEMQRKDQHLDPYSNLSILLPD